MIWIILLAIGGGLAALPAILNSLKSPMTPAARSDWPGMAADLPQGVTRYRWFGGARGPVIVAIHGLTTPSEAWEPLAQRLTSLGYRVLVYDLFGRGGSDDGPQDPQDVGFHVRQLGDLLDGLGVQDSFTLLGYSMGGKIAAGFAAQAPHRVQRVVLLASAGMDLTETPITRFCRDVPVLGDWVHAVFAGRGLRRGSRVSAQLGAEGKSIARAMRRQLDRKGYLRSVLSSYRGTLAPDGEPVFRAMARTGMPVLAIWGDADDVIPISARDKLASWVPLAQQHVVEGAGHELPYSHPTAVVEEISNAVSAGATGRG